MSEAVKLSIVPESSENLPEQVLGNLNVGERLALARSNQELSVEQVAGQLKWSVRQIAEIEAGHYSVFPDMLTVRGFVRTYAKILKIDSTVLLQDIEAEYEKLPTKVVYRPQLDTPFPTGHMPLLGRHHNSSQKIFGGLILLLLCLLAMFVWRAELLGLAHSVYPTSAGTGIVQANNAGDQGVNTELTQGIPIGSSSLSIPEENTQSGSVAPAARAGSAIDSAVSTEPQIESRPVGSSSVIPHQYVENKPPAAFSAAHSLILRFRQDSWVQIKRLNASIVASRLYKAGTEETILVNEPMNLVIGNALGVSAQLHGQDLLLPVQPGSNVVNLSIK